MAMRRSVIARPYLSNRRELSMLGMSAMLIGFRVSSLARTRGSLRHVEGYGPAFPFQTGGVIVSHRTLGRSNFRRRRCSHGGSFRQRRSETMLTVIDSGFWGKCAQVVMGN